MPPITLRPARPCRPRPGTAEAPRSRSTARRRAGAATAAFACAAALLTGLAAPATGQPTARVDNPYAGVTPYVNPDWSAHAAAEPGGEAVADEPTAVWLDSIAAIEGTGGRMGLKDHLDAALAQGAGLVQLVLYDLPGRDCDRLSSNGELGPGELDRYESEFIDPVASILSDPAYADLRVVTVVEPDSLQNLVLHTGSRADATAACNTMLDNGNYVNGVGYALAALGALPSVYAYLDASYHGEIGWPDDAGPTLDLLHEAASSAGSTPQDVAGFIVNTANYGVLHEEYFTATDTVNGTSVTQSRWVDWNPFVDELPFADAVRLNAVDAGFDAGTGILIDTSRNGWGGPARPTGPGPLTDVNAYVDGGRLDRRSSTAAWCNQDGAGLGERPTAQPSPGIDAYIWAKPPGESDGSLNGSPSGGFGGACDPDGDLTGHPHDGDPIPTGALPDPPGYGEWFPAAFRQLLANAWPPAV